MQCIRAELLASAGQLLLEYNECTGEIHRILAATARKLAYANFDLAVSYGGVVVSFGDDAPVLKPVRELRYNADVQARIHLILAAVCRGDLDANSALHQLLRIEADSRKHSRWLAVVVLGTAAACLAILLGADLGAVLVAGTSTALGLLIRQELGRRHFTLLALPFSAAFIGAAVGGLAIRFGWTATPGHILIVPSLMLVPGPHLINGLMDLVDNYLPMSLARLGLATGILFAGALGIVAGMELTLTDPPTAAQSAGPDQLNLGTDMLLAGIVTCGFAMYYNAAWPHIALAAIGGMMGHGLRYLLSEAGCRLDVATFFGGLAIGVVAALVARTYKLPFAVVAFAGAVTMMPGVQMYRALRGSLQLAHLKAVAELPMIAGTLGDASQACVVVARLPWASLLGHVQ